MLFYFKKYSTKEYLMKKAIVGLSGVGTSSVSKELARILGYSEKNIFSIGDQFRVLAKERGFENDLARFREIASRKGSDVDDIIDGRAGDFFQSNQDCIVEGRLAAFLAPPEASLILLRCDRRVSVQRVMDRDKGKPGYATFEEAWQTITLREIEDRRRYLAKYGERAMNFDEPAFYEGFKIFDTTHPTISEVAHQIAGYVKTKEIPTAIT